MTATTLVDSYLDEIGRHPLLSAEDERQLAQRIEAGRWAAQELQRHERLPDRRRTELLQVVALGRQARQRFIECNLRLVASLARSYRCSGLSFLDLVQEGNIGLVRAVERFDHRRGFRFSTYATWIVRQSITRAIANTSRTIRLPVWAGELKARVERARRQLEADGGRPPGDSELAAFLDMETVDVRDALRWGSDPLPLSDPAGGEGPVIADDASVPVADEALSWAVRSEVERLLFRLRERERQVVVLRFGLEGGEPQTLAAVGATLGVSQQTVAAIQNAALSKLRRHALGRQSLHDLLAS